MVGAGRCVFVGITVPVELMEDADELSSSYVSVGSSTRGSGGGMDESFVLAKDLARSDIVSRFIGKRYRSKNGVN